MDFLPQARANGKKHARFAPYPTTTDAIPPDVEASAIGDADDIPFIDPRQFMEEFGPLFEREMVLLAIFSLAENNKRRGGGFYAYPSHQFLAERLYGDPSPRGTGKIKRHIAYFKKFGLLIITPRRPSKNKRPQTNLYMPTGKCFEFIRRIVAFAVEGVFLGGTSTRDENRPLVLKEEYIERVSLGDENRPSSAQEHETEQETPSISAITDNAVGKEQEKGEEIRERQDRDRDKATSHNLMRTDIATNYQTSEIHTQVAKLVKQHPERTRLLRIKVREQERDGTSQKTILEALATTEAANPGNYAAYFTARCRQLRQDAETAEAARRRSSASDREFKRKFASNVEESLAYKPDIPLSAMFENILRENNQASMNRH
jgi:hypothetical protein